MSLQHRLTPLAQRGVVTGREAPGDRAGLLEIAAALIAALLARGETVRAAAARAHVILHHALARPRRIGEGLALPGRLADAVAATEPDADPAI